MKNRFLYSILVLFVSTLILWIPRIALAQSPSILTGLTWLNAVQASDGSWGSDLTATDSVQATSAVLKSLQVLDNTSSPNYVNAANWRLCSISTQRATSQNDYRFPRLLQQIRTRYSYTLISHLMHGVDMKNLR